MAGTEYRSFWKYLKKGRKLYPPWMSCEMGLLSPSSHKFGDEFIASGLSAEGAITGFGPENT